MSIRVSLRAILTIATLSLSILFPTSAAAAPVTVCLGAVPADRGCDNQASSLALAVAAVNAEPELDTLYIGPGQYTTSGVTFTSPVRVRGVGADRSAVRITGVPGNASDGLLRFRTLPSSVHHLTVETSGAGNAIRVEPLAQSPHAFALEDSVVTAVNGLVATGVETDASTSIVRSQITARDAVFFQAYRSARLEIAESQLTAAVTAVTAFTERPGDVRLSIDRSRLRYSVDGLYARNDVMSWNPGETGVTLATRVTNSSLERTGAAGQGTAFRMWERVAANGIADLTTDTSLDVEHVTVSGPHRSAFFLQIEPSTDYTAGTVRHLDARVRASHIAADATYLTETICGENDDQQALTFTAERSALDESARADDAGCVPHLRYDWLDNIAPATVQVIDAAGGDLRPTANSTLVDAAGCSASSASRGHDLAGGTRLVDGPRAGTCDPAADIGAWEYQRARPVVTVTTAPNAPVLAGSQVQLTATAVDPDPGETAGITSSWTLPGGASASGLVAAFTAPSTPGAYTATVTATDAVGERGTASVTIMVVAPASQEPANPTSPDPTPPTTIERTVTVEVPAKDTTAPTVRMRLASTSAALLTSRRPLLATVTSSEPVLLTCTVTARIRVARRVRTVPLLSSTTAAWSGTTTTLLAPTTRGASMVRAALKTSGARLVDVGATCTARDVAGNRSSAESAATIRADKRPKSRGARRTR